MLRVSLAFAMVGVAALPLYAPLVPDWVLPEDVERLLDGHTLEDVAADVAQREWTPHVRVVPLDVESDRTTRGSFDEPIRAEHGSTYWHVRVRVENLARMPVGVYTHHFDLVDDANVTYPAELGLRHGLFVMRLQQGDAHEGVLVFEVEDGIEPTRIRWRGDLAEAEAPMPRASSA